MATGIIFKDYDNNPVYPCPYFPVGFIYFSMSDVNPGTIFGGTWKRIKDKFILCAGDNYLVGSTGGESQHTLTISEMPSHNHPLSYRTDTSISTGSSGQWTTDPGTHPYYSNSGIDYKGGGQAHNNMPPYIAVYVWRRIS